MLEKYLDLLRALDEAKIKYLVIGGFAAIMHGLPRFTKDLDLAIVPELATCQAILETMKRLRFGTAYFNNVNFFVATNSFCVRP